MSVEQLREEMLEYHLRVEEVLSGMDRALTDLSNRMSKVERGSTASTSKGSNAEPTLRAEVSDLKERVEALGAAIVDLISERR